LAVAVNVAVAELPAPASFEVTLPVVFVKTYPDGVPTNGRTDTEKLHDPPAAKVAALRLTDAPPAAAVIVPPPHEPVSPLGFWTKRLAGKVSVKPTPVSGTVPGLVTLNVNVEVCPKATVAGWNAFVMTGGDAGGAVTVRVAVPGFPSLLTRG
jgi:hypothetical protein